MAAKPLIPAKAVKDLRPGDLVRCDSPRGYARITEARTLPQSMVQPVLGGDPKPGIFLKFLFMDGAKRGEFGDTLLHPDDQVKLPA